MILPLLLDTNACIWWIDGVLSLHGETALAAAYNNGQSVHVSPITALEVATLARKGRFRSPLDPQRWFETLMAKPGLALAPMPPEVLIASQQLPGAIHKDPADRIIAATARMYGHTVMTGDEELLAYGRGGYLAVLECSRSGPPSP